LSGAPHLAYKWLL